MVTQEMKEISQGQLSNKEARMKSNSLANRALLEQTKYGEVRVECPMCHEKPVVAMTSNRERTTIKCKCGFIKSEEINF